MDPKIRVNLDNTVQQTIYKFYFFSATGIKENFYKNDKFTCVMARPDNVTLELDILLKANYI